MLRAVAFRSALWLGLTAGLVVGCIGLAGSAGATTPKLKAPGAPRALVVTPVDTALSLVWAPPTSDGGAAISSYTSTASSRGLPTETCSSVATYCELFGIVNPVGKAKNVYKITVTATNSIGTGKAVKAKSAGTTAQNCSNAGLVQDGNLQGCGFTGRALAGVDLSGASLINTQFGGANLTNANLGSANLTGANLKGATITGTNFASATWSNTTCPDGTNSNSDGGTCANNLACLTHSDGVGQSYVFCGPLGTSPSTFNATMAMDAADAWAASVGLTASDVSTATCGSAPSDNVATVFVGSNPYGYTWQFAGAGEGDVAQADNCGVKIGSWN